MVKGMHGMTKKTFDRLLVDAGKVVFNYGIAGKERDFGATLGGNTFATETEYKDIQPDGARGKIRGGRRITSVAAALTTNMLEMTLENMQAAIPGSDITEEVDEKTGKKYRSLRRTRDIEDQDYFDNVALIGTLTGSGDPVVIIVYNAMNDENFELAREDKEESTTELVFSAHFDPDAMEAEPWEIRYPVIEEETPAPPAGQTFPETAPGE